MALESTVRDAYDWMMLLGLGGLVGALGQGVRSIVGLKKVHDAAAGSDASAAESIDAGRLIVSLGVGFIAGALAAIGLLQQFPKVTSEQIFALAAAGYAGADFIEGFVSRVSGSTTVPAGEDVKGVAPVSSGGRTLTGPALAAAADDAVG
jgi:hypothetical protein